VARYLVLDWDHQQLLIVAATVKGRAVRLEKAAAFETPQSPNPAEAESLGQMLRERLHSAGIAPAPVLISIGRDRVVLKDIRHPAVPPAEEAAVVRFQAIRELNDPADEVAIDYVARAEAGPTGERRALAVILRRELLHTYQRLCKGAGLKLAGICPRPFGAASCARHAGAKDTVAILNVSERWVEFSVARGDQLLLARSVALPAASDDALLGEIRRNLAVFAGQSPQDPVRALFVADGTTAGNLRIRLQDRLAIPVHVLDPIDQLAAPGERRGLFAGAVGLLHALTEGGRLPINFSKVRDAVPAADPNRRKVALVASLAAVVLLAGAALAYSELSKRSTELADLVRTKSLLDQQIVALRDDEKRLKAVGEWVSSEVVWLDELYDLADRVPDVNAVRVTSVTADPLTRTGSGKHVARLTIKGVTTDDSKPVNALMDRLVSDGFYRVEPKLMSRNTSTDRRNFSQQFTAKLDVEPRPPARYLRRLPPAPPAALRPRGGNPGAGARDLNAIFGGGRP